MSRFDLYCLKVAYTTVLQHHGIILIPARIYMFYSPILSSCALCCLLPSLQIPAMEVDAISRDPWLSFPGVASMNQVIGQQQLI